MELISRKEAISKNLKRYFTGKSCKRGHISERLVSDRQCITCSIHKSMILEKKNPNRKKDRHTKESYARRADFFYERCAYRRAFKKQATPKWANRSEIVKIYKECRNLSRTTGIPHHVDHIIPLQNKLVCGLHVHWNLQILTATENISKNNKFEIE